MIIDRNYLNKDFPIAFRLVDDCYLYEHDALVRYIETEAPNTMKTISGRDRGLHTWLKPPKWAHVFLSECKLP